jgi:outer membrane protein assembly factor BamB
VKHAALFALLVATVAGSPAAVAAPPSPDQPVGWRGDGTGRYPDAKPPTKWERRKVDGGYRVDGIRWAAPLPAIGVSSPIIVGDRVYLTTEPNDLVCLDKATGRILWVRSNPTFEALPADDRKAEPAYADKLEPLAKDLAAMNEQVVAALNAKLATAATAAPGPPDASVKRKQEIEKKIGAEQVAIDKKLFGTYWGQAVFGFAGATPVSDGKRVVAFFTTGVTACYDLDGNRKWVARGAGGGSEHGNFASPILCDGKVFVWANEMRAYDVETGKLAWSAPAKAFNTYGSLFRLRVGGEWVACQQWGFFFRVRDGEPVWDKGAFGDSVTTPVVEGDTIYAATGYPKYNDKTKGLRAFTVPPTLGPGKLVAKHAFPIDWADDEVPEDKQKSPFARGYVASPLYVDGLIYQLTQVGGLSVHDAATGALAYRKALPLSPKTQYWNWAGCSASPTLAGPYVYVMDNQGTTLAIKPGRAYAEVAKNVIEESKDGKEQAQILATPVFEGTRMYQRTPGFLYCIGGE